MNNPFKPTTSVVNKPNRNAFDLSHSYHMTCNMGQLIPALCLETLPGDSFEIDSAAALRFMPLSFPIQTKCKFYAHFFYQRTKNLWPDFLDFINGNDKLQNRQLVPPYIDFSNSKNTSLLRTCSLGDYLGLPTVRYSSAISKSADAAFVYVKTGSNVSNLSDYNYKSTSQVGQFPSTANIGVSSIQGGFSPFEVKTDNGVKYPRREMFGQVMFKLSGSMLDLYNKVERQGRFVIDFPPQYSFDLNNVFFTVYKNDSNTAQLPGMLVGSADAEPIEMKNSDDATVIGTRVTFNIQFTGDLASWGDETYYIGVCSRFTSTPMNVSSELPQPHFTYENLFVNDAVADSSGSPLTSNPYYISALPFRCYESIYNAFYRDNRNNPFKRDKFGDGKPVPVYNEYLPTTDGGADPTNYGIYNRNWEMDQFTSAVQNPQQGVAPLVGISSLGNVTFAYDGTEYTFTSETADDADTITKINVTENVPDSVARSIVNVATSGISINDFRNVNAYQRWLETNIRRGLKYKDQVLARWGVEPKDSTLDMPEFIGGFSVDVDINTVTNTSSGPDNVLGDYAAQATAFGGSQHKINHFCDQHGFIMCIVSVVPTPVYTQTLDKMFLRNSALDFYSPEFDQIGMQAITYGELCPLELYSDTSSTIKPSTVFGYQRPWYEYIYKNDSAHGLFRNDFNQFLLSRTFSNPPVLGSDFLTIKQSSLNDVFSVHNSNNVLGMIRFNITAKRPIPAVSVPNL